ncbi:MAG TPA: DUF167 domain-containing protein [Steroidobacteraceae bacterium]|nr:DUF167 domain-containing protein [Steroidobacteraceae bacterium]
MARTLKVKVKAGSRIEELAEQEDGTWLVRVKAPPVDGRANEAVIALLATRFGVRKAQVSIKSGASSRVKLIFIAD